MPALSVSTVITGTYVLCAGGVIMGLVIWAHAKGWYDARAAHAGLSDEEWRLVTRYRELERARGEQRAFVAAVRIQREADAIVTAAFRAPQPGEYDDDDETDDDREGGNDTWV